LGHKVFNMFWSFKGGSWRVGVCFQLQMCILLVMAKGIKSCGLDWVSWLITIGRQFGVWMEISMQYDELMNKRVGCLLVCMRIIPALIILLIIFFLISLCVREVLPGIVVMVQRWVVWTVFFYLKSGVLSGLIVFKPRYLEEFQIFLLFCWLLMKRIWVHVHNDCWNVQQIYQVINNLSRENLSDIGYNKVRKRLIRKNWKNWTSYE